MQFLLSICHFNCIYVLQRLVQDRVSLEAAVSTASTNLQESAGKLDAVVGEIGELQGQLRGLREQLEVTQKNQVGIQVCIWDLYFILSVVCLFQFFIV